MRDDWAERNRDLEEFLCPQPPSDFLHHPAILFCVVQWLYLTSTLGEDAVVLHAVPGRPVDDGRVNTVPVGLVRDLEGEGDLFVSMWALNESTEAAQRHVAERRWFGSPGLLLGMHTGHPLEQVLVDCGARSVPIGDHIPGRQYVMR
ncbi:MAG: hypothetical protein KY443_04685 [Actinobacteria bacterium]|nr:hypothetical protein [Actinomycetota bacterium]